MEEADPDRCQGNYPGGQCTYKAIPGTEFCRKHSHNLVKYDSLLKLNSARAQGRLAKNFDPLEVLEETKSICDRIIERVENLKADDPSGILAPYTPKLCILAARITKTASATAKTLNTLWHKSVVIDGANGVIELILDAIGEGPTLNRIRTRVLTVVAEATIKNRNVPRANTPVFQIEDDRLQEIRNHHRLWTLNEHLVLCVINIEDIWSKLVGTPMEMAPKLKVLIKYLEAIEKLVIEAHKSAQEIGDLLDQETFEALRTSIFTIVTEELRALPNNQDIFKRLKYIANDDDLQPPLSEID